MKVGDQVRMKYQMFWYLKSNPRINYRDSIATVVSVASHMMEIMRPDMSIVRMDKDFFEVVDEAR